MRRSLSPFLIAGLIAMFGFNACNAADNVRKGLPAPAVDEQLAAAKGKQTVVVAGGCFWGIQAVFQHLKGVLEATSGYAGGEAATAHYEMVSSGRTSHAE